MPPVSPSSDAPAVWGLARLGIPILAILPQSLWPRLCLLMVAAIGPLMALLVVSAVSDARRVRDDTMNRMGRLASLAAQQQDDLMQEVSSLLRVLARVPEVQSVSGPGCDDLLGTVATDYPKLGGLAVVGTDGIVACSLNPAAKGLSVADRPYFKQALASRLTSNVVMSPLTVSRTTGRPAVFLATSVLDAADGEPIGVVLAALDLGWFTRLANGIPGLQDHLVVVLDSRDGAVLAQSPDLSHRVGERFPGHPVLQALARSPDGGSLRATDIDGTDRIFGFAPLPGKAIGLVVAIGVPEATMLTEVDRRFWLSMAIALATVACAVMAAWVIATLTVLRPIGALVSTAIQVGSGDLSANASMGRCAAKELRTLAEAFTHMARRLQVRDGRIAAMQQEIAVSEEHHRLLADSVTDIITRYSLDFVSVYVSPACLDLLGYRPEEIVGQHLSLRVHPEDWQRLSSLLQQPLLVGAPMARAVYRAVRKDGTVIWMESSGRRLEDGSGFVMVARDVSERQKLETRLEQANRQLRILAREDSLTRLANRRRFDEVLGEEYRRAMRVGSPLAMLMLDVDRFKTFNDHYGHPGGDACLRALAGVIEGLARRPADLAARYGGEEFVILLPDTDTAGALALAECICDGVRELAVPHAGSEFGFVTVSVGVAVMVPFAGIQSPASLVEAADAALYEAKRAGRNTVRIADAQTATQAG